MKHARLQVLWTKESFFRVQVVSRVRTLQVWPTGVGAPPAEGVDKAQPVDESDKRAFWLWERSLPTETSAGALPTSLWGTVCAPHGPESHPEGDADCQSTSSHSSWPFTSLPPAVIQVRVSVTRDTLTDSTRPSLEQVAGKSQLASHAYSGNWRFSLMTEHPRGSFVRHMRKGKVQALHS